MIVRHFAAKATQRNAGKYFAFFRDTLTPQLKNIGGYRGALVLSNSERSEVQITVLTFWESDDAIRRFAGETPSMAVVEPEARAILSWFSDSVTRLVVEVDTLHGV